MSTSASPCDITTCPGGPYLVRGALAVYDEAGTEFLTHRPVVAICRCRRSSRKPWCDGTHKMLPSTGGLTPARLVDIGHGRLEVHYDEAAPE